MQGGNRQYLGKRSSFSNFSPYRGGASHNGSLQDQMMDSQSREQQFPSYGGQGSSGVPRDGLLDDYGAGVNPTSAIRGHSHSHSHSFQPPPPLQHHQFSNGSSTSSYGYSNPIPPHYTHSTPGHPLYSTYNHHSRRNAYYESHWPLYSTDWTTIEYANADIVAVGTFSEDQNTNKIQILHATKPNPESLQLSQATESVVSYPTTKIAWEPRPSSSTSSTSSTTASNTSSTSSPSRLRMISTGDCLRLWDYDYEARKLVQRSTLLNKSKSEFLPPLTSFDWNKVDTSLVITSSIDTTCTIWDINTSTARTQLIAHDSEVNDVAYVASSVDIFASVGADGSVRVFDLRSLDHSTIIYEPANPVPLLRISANPQDRNVLAAIAQDSNKIFVLDIRFPGVPIATLDGHQKAVNSIAWAPATGKNSQRRHILASGSDDCQVLVWDLTSQQQHQSTTPSTNSLDTSAKDTNPSPIYSFTDTIEVNNIGWSATAEWLGVVSGKGLQGVRFV